MADVLLIALIAAGILEALRREHQHQRRAQTAGIVTVTLTADISRFRDALDEASAALQTWVSAEAWQRAVIDDRELMADTGRRSFIAGEIIHGLIAEAEPSHVVIDETHHWPDLDAMHEVLDALPTAAEAATSLTSFMRTLHGPGEHDIETLPDGCWRTILDHSTYLPCNRPASNDLGLCDIHTQELRHG